MEKTIYDLKLHETLTLNGADNSAAIFITRVPSGWIYSSGGSGIFIPYSDEFDEKALDKLYRTPLVAPVPETGPYSHVNVNDSKHL